MKPFVCLKNVYKSYGYNIKLPNLFNLNKKRIEPTDLKKINRKNALENISFSVNDGERIGIIGANGAGKSSLLSIIAGISKQSSGDVAVVGKIHAMLTVGTGIKEELTGKENLYLIGALQGKSRAEMEADLNEMIDFSELADFIDQPVRIYSSGMKARLAFTSSVFIKPEILLIDETLSVGDVKFTNKATAMIKKICDAGRIVIIVSHNLESILSMCNRCIWIDSGKIMLDSSTDIVVSAYREYIRKLNEDNRKHDLSSKISLPNDNNSIDSIFSNFQAYSQGEPFKNYMIEEGKHLKIKVDITNNAIFSKVKLFLKIERMDGICITENQCPESIFLTDNGETITCLIDCGIIRMRPGLYIYKIFLENDNEIISELIKIFEVVATSSVAGGVPTFRWPAEVVIKKLINSEVSV